MSDEKNLGGRPEIGGMIPPVNYGDTLKAEIDRQAAGGGQSRAAWLRESALERVNRTVPTDISWQQMTEAGIDTDQVERLDQTDPASGYKVDTWKATSPDGTRFVIFGYSTADTNDVIPDGQHKGWDVGWYDVEDDDGELIESYSSGEYYEPYDWRSMLADVAKVAPLAADIAEGA